jgi:hypothetical protein
VEEACRRSVCGVDDGYRHGGGLLLPLYFVDLRERSHELACANLFSFRLFAEEKGNAEREKKQKSLRGDHREMKRTVVRSCSAVGRLRPQSGQERHRGLATLVSRTSLPDNAASHRHTAPQHLHGRLTPLLRTTRRSYATPSSSAHDADRIIDGRKLADQIVLCPPKTLPARRCALFVVLVGR